MQEYEWTFVYALRMPLWQLRRRYASPSYGHRVLRKIPLHDAEQDQDRSASPFAPDGCHPVALVAQVFGDLPGRLPAQGTEAA